MRIAAAVGLTLYFLGAAVTHPRAGDRAGLGVPLFPAGIAIATLVVTTLSI
jgi:hypothetical protein